MDMLRLILFACNLILVWGVVANHTSNSENPECFKFPICGKYDDKCSVPMKETTTIKYNNMTLKQIGMAKFVSLGSVYLLDSSNTTLYKLYMSLTVGLWPAMRIFAKGCDHTALWTVEFGYNQSIAAPRLSISAGRVTFGEGGEEFGTLKGGCAGDVSRMAIIGHYRLRSKLLCLKHPWEDSEGKFIDEEQGKIVPHWNEEDEGRQEGEERQEGEGRQEGERHAQEGEVHLILGEEGGRGGHGGRGRHGDGGGGHGGRHGDDGRGRHGGGGRGGGGRHKVISKESERSEYEADDGTTVAEHHIYIQAEVEGELRLDEEGHLIKPGRRGRQGRQD